MFTLDDLAVALNRPIDPAEEGYYQYLIDSVSAYIEGETGTAFALHSDETVRYRADGWGVVELVGPVVDVASIAPVSNSYGGFAGCYGAGPSYDGMAELYGAYPYEVLDVTYTYGYALEDVPEDIKTTAISAVISAINNSAGQGDLEEKTVGDITYRYRFTELDFDSFGLSALNAYRGVAETWRL